MMKFKEIIIYALVFCICFVSAKNCDKCDCSQSSNIWYSCSCFKEMYNNCFKKDILDLFYVLYDRIEEIIIRDISLTLNFTKNLTKLKKLTLKSCNIDIIDKNSFYNMDKMAELTIEDNEIKILAGDAFEDHKNLLYLNLKNNSLREFPDTILKNLEELRYFNLGLNEICELSSTLFTNSKDLMKIYLNKNKITYLPNDIFEGLTHLKEIDLADNKIKELPDGIFGNLPGLEKICLQNNELTSIKFSTFENSPEIKKIHLEGNKIQYLDWNILNLQQLNYMNIPDSSIKCDCKTKQYINTYKQRKISGDIQCSNTKKISNLSDGDFACAPKILNCIEGKEKNYTKLSCLINGFPLPYTFWRFNGSNIFNNTLYNLKIEQVNEDIWWSNLTILMNSINMSGSYEIEAENNGGRTNYISDLKILDEDHMVLQTSGYTGWIIGFSAGVLCVVAMGAVAAFVYKRMGGHRHSPVETVEPKTNNKKTRTRSNCYSIDLDEVVTTVPSKKSNYIPRDEGEKNFLEQQNLLAIQGITDNKRDSSCSTESNDNVQHM